MALMIIYMIFGFVFAGSLMAMHPDKLNKPGVNAFIIGLTFLITSGIWPLIVLNIVYTTLKKD